MRYQNTCPAVFLRRPNRFVAEVTLPDGTCERVHVKNTGRCAELLIPGASVTLAASENPARKTRFDLVSVQKPGLGWVNIDSQAPNQVMAEWLAGQGWDRIQPEYRYGASRVDFSLWKGERQFLLEVKGCTLEVGGVGYFPDAPTERGVKHLRELTAAAQSGLGAAAAFVIPMEGVREVRPNMRTHPAFGEALETARQAGVEVWFACCRVTADTLEIGECLRT